MEDQQKQGEPKRRRMEPPEEKADDSPIAYRNTTSEAKEDAAEANGINLHRGLELGATGGQQDQGRFVGCSERKKTVFFFSRRVHCTLLGTERRSRPCLGGVNLCIISRRD